MENYGLKTKFKPVTHIFLKDGREFLIVETNRFLQIDGSYKIDFSLYEIHNGVADTLLGKGNNPLVLEKKYIKK